jgi:glycosyltransferase involved in cell wall biosynthesis
MGYALEAMGADRCVHWEHGAAWHGGREAERLRYLKEVPIAIANSTAAARVLQLRWGYRGELHVCRNALRPSIVPLAPVAKLRGAGPIVLGVAARLFPVKGVAIALQAVAELRVRGVDVELKIAGEGPELARLRELAAALGIAARVTFLGALADMAMFYRSVDCLLHTPLTEAFGLVALEAAAHGCPVIATAIDGLSESVTDGVTGYALEPTLSLDDYVALGGGREGLPERVYAAASDALVETRALSPVLLATTVERLFERAATFETLSERASRHVLAAPDFAAHVRGVLDVIDGFLRRRT